MVEIKFTGLTGETVREIAAELSKARDDIPTYNGSGSIADWWCPTVRCEGPELWGLATPTVPSHVAAPILEIVARMEASAS